MSNDLREFVFVMKDWLIGFVETGVAAAVIVGFIVLVAETCFKEQADMIAAFLKDQSDDN